MILNGYESNVVVGAIRNAGEWLQEVMKLHPGIELAGGDIVCARLETALQILDTALKTEQEITASRNVAQDRRQMP